MTQPEEPPDGSVVLDGEGQAWQRVRDRWRAAGDYDREPWSVVCSYGPVRVIYQPEGVTDA